jgi:phosphoribosylformylglycinamidine cyclo-ligase
MSAGKSDLYAAAGVDIDLAHTLLDRVKANIKAARRPEMLTEIGGFGGLFALDVSKYDQPVIVSSVDGVGTKLMVAAMLDKHDTVGYDIVNHCINDIAVIGAEPLYFMDYLGIGKLKSPLYEEVLNGLAEACKAQNVALLGGETAEMPGMYGDDYDLVGAITGVVDKSKMITGEAIQAGDVVIGLASNGLHTNGYSLARKVLFDQAGYTASQELDVLGESVGLALLHPHTCYWPAIREALAAGLPLNGIAHITGGGFYDNIPRVLPDNVDVAADGSVMDKPPIFGLIQEHGDISDEEMYRVFNMGVGMTWMVSPESAASALSICRDAGFTAAQIGEVVDGTGVVQMTAF